MFLLAELFISQQAYRAPKPCQLPFPNNEHPPPYCWPKAVQAVSQANYCREAPDTGCPCTNP